MNSVGDDSPVLLYKAQGSDSNDNLAVSDLMLCLQTSTQRRFMIDFGNSRMVCMDSTHGTNQYDFNLVTVLVVDDFGEGNPVAFMISNREDEIVLREFFTAIKSRLPQDVQFSASHIMTDDASQYFNAWQAVFGSAEKRLCTWHLDWSWRRGVEQHVSDANLQLEVYHMLRTLLQELNSEEFEKNLTAFMDHMQSVAPAFATYFRPYCSRTSEWAYCYRIGIQANTNMYVESFHNVLKSAYMERKANRRVDSLVFILLKIARDKVFERFIKVGKNTQSTKQRSITKRHVITLTRLPPMFNDAWIVPSCSTDGYSYWVFPASESCTCNLRCMTCQCCPHLYECSCLDFAIHMTVCKHIHTIHHLRSVEATVDNTSNAGVESNGQLISDSSETLPHSTVESNSLDASGTVTSSQTVDDILVLRNRLEMQCRKIIAAGHASSSREALLCAIKHTRTACATFKGIERIAPPKFNIARRNPPNKKLSSQPRCFSTKIKRSKIQNRLYKPSAADVAVAKKKLSSAKSRVGLLPKAVESPLVQVPAEKTTEINDFLQPNVVDVADEGVSLLGDDCYYRR